MKWRYIMFGLFEKKYNNTVTLKIDGMMCGHCEAHVADALRKVDGVEKVQASHTKKTAIVQSNSPLDKEALKKLWMTQDIQCIKYAKYNKC